MSAPPGDVSHELTSTVSVDKDQVLHVEKIDRNRLSSEDREFLESFPPEKKRKLLRKVDVRLVPMLCLFYLFSFLDRANIGNAQIEGLPQDLHLNGAQYNTCLAIFFVPYVLLEIPSNYFLSRIERPSLYMGILLTGWGTCMTLAGVTQNFAGLLVVRFFLGVFEAGFFPGAIYLVSTWYMPDETQTRVALFYTASALSGAFSGLLAAGISQMGGVGGLGSWRWIFILEGIMTVLAGVASFFLMIDSPARSTRWLEQDEIRYLELRQRADSSRQADAAESSPRKILWSVLTDWQLYLQALSFWGNSVPNNALKFTMPQIMQDMGYKSTNAQLLTVPPYIAGAIVSYVAALFADRIRWRMPFVAGPLCLVIIAFAILFSKSEDIQNNIPVAYFAIVLSCIGLYPLNPATSAWTVNNLSGTSKRAMGIAFMICMGNTGGMVGSYIFLAQEAPRYPTGFGSSFAFAAAGIVAALTLEFVYHTINKKRDKMTAVEVYQRYSHEELEAMGDRSPFFRYVL